MVEVDKDKCIGCGACIAICSEGFELDSENKAEVKDKNADCIDKGISACPVDAIKK